MAWEGVVPADRVPLMVPRLPTADELMPYLQQIDANRWYTNFGPLVGNLEQRLVRAFPGEFGPVSVVTTSSGTAALELALMSLGLPAGATVLLPALTFVATATAVLRAGYRPLIADVDAACWQLTPDMARDYVRQHHVDAVMPVATFGLAQPVNAWDAFAGETGLPVLIDAAGAFGNQRPGRLAHVVFSLHATKALAAGEGGFLVTHDTDLAARVRSASNFGIGADGQVNEPGGNGKLSEYHAAVALAALDAWPATCEARRRVRRRYVRQLHSACPAVTLQQDGEDGVYPILVVALPDGCDARRACRQLGDAGIETRQWYCPTLDRHPAFARFAPQVPSTANSLSMRLVGLPFFLDISHESIDRVCRSMANVLPPTSSGDSCSMA